MIYRPNDEQRDVICRLDPVLIVSGGAGTGKTVTAVSAARRHLQESDRELSNLRSAAERRGVRSRLPASDRVLFLSFSRTAVAQIMDRAGSVIGPFASRVEIATFHGFAWRIISSFGRNHGLAPPLTVISAASNRLPDKPSGLTYQELIPQACRLLSIDKVSQHYSSRYSLIVCDEFQDTDDQEWVFLQSIAPSARRILLGDLNQSIYRFKPGVDGARRLLIAQSLQGAQTINLPAASYRDPTGVLPAAAEAARLRQFDDPAIRAAVTSRRLRVTQISTGSGYDDVISLARQARQDGHTVNVFTHTNEATVELSDALTSEGVLHEQVGFGEAYGEALSAQASLIRYAFGQPVDHKRALAVYITSTTRGNGAPPLALQVMKPSSNPILERALGRLESDLIDAASSGDTRSLADRVAEAYARIGTQRGHETWAQAARRTRSILASIRGNRDPVTVADEITRLGEDSLVGFMAPRRRPIQVMNLHQTKGREADTTILLLRESEFYGREGEPFREGSRLMYVVMTRARKQSHIVVPSTTHPLWQPLINVCRAAAQF